MTQSVNAALFDLGGVLIHWDPSVAYRAAFPDESELVERFLAGPLTEIGLASCETPGPLAPLAATFIKKYADTAPEFTPLFEFFANDWARFVIGPMPQSVELLQALRGTGLRLAGLTNWPEATFPPRGDAFGFLDWFEGIVVSGTEGMRKPGAEIFTLTAERFGLVPARTLYVDDHPGNVEAASAVGFRAHHFVSANGLASWLREEGVLLNLSSANDVEGEDIGNGRTK